MKTQLSFVILAIIFSSTLAATFTNPVSVIEGQLSGDNKNIYRCVFDCLYDKIDLGEALRIIGKCVNAEEPLPCFAQELGEILYQCVSKCYQTTEHATLYALESNEKCEERVKQVREHYAKLDLKEKQDLFKKAKDKLTQKYPDVSEKKIGFFLATVVFDKVPPKVPCLLYKKHFKKDTTVGKIDYEETTETKSECQEKVEKTREYFSGLDREQKKEFVKKVYKKLTETYPNVERSKVGVFIAALLFKRVDAEKVCALYKKIFRGGEVVENKFKGHSKKIKCVVNCLKKSYDAENILKVVLECKTDLTCYKNHVLPEVRDCVSHCSSETEVSQVEECPEKVEKVRKYFDGLNLKEKAEFVRKTYQKLHEKYPTVERVKVAHFLGALLYQRVPAQKVCELYDKIFKSKTFELKDLPRCIFNCLTESLPLEKILQILAKCLNSEDQLACFASELGEVLYQCVSRCYSSKTEVKVNEEPSCPEKVNKVRKHFSELNLKDKAVFVKKAYEKLHEKYPTVERVKVAHFLGALLYQRVPAQKVCELYDKIFKSNTFQLNDLPRCVFNCLYESLPLEKVLQILGKCLNVEDQLACFASELGEVLYQCVSRCYRQKNTAILNEDTQCADKVTKVRSHFKSLEADAKKQFFKKVVEKLNTKYPNVEKRKVGFFTASLLFDYVPASVPCGLYKKFFKSEEVQSNNNTLLPCLYRCMQDHMSMWEVIQIQNRCGRNFDCLRDAMNDKAKTCAEKCK